MKHHQRAAHCQDCFHDMELCPGCPCHEPEPDDPREDDD